LFSEMGVERYSLFTQGVWCQPLLKWESRQCTS